MCCLLPLLFWGYVLLAGNGPFYDLPLEEQKRQLVIRPEGGKPKHLVYISKAVYDKIDEYHGSNATLQAPYKMSVGGGGKPVLRVSAAGHCRLRVGLVQLSACHLSDASH